MTFRRLSALVLALVAANAAPVLVHDAAATAHPTVLVVGDSLSSGYGIPPDEGWVSLLQQRLREQGFPHVVANESVPGETTEGGLQRLPELLEAHRPDVVLIELGARDALADQPLDVIAGNLQRMVRLSRDSGARVALFEMLVPPERKAPPYPAQLRETYRQVASAEGAALVPFFLGSIVGRPEAFQADHLHPTADVQPELLEAVWPSVARVLRASERAGRAATTRARVGAAGR